MVRDDRRDDAHRLLCEIGDGRVMLSGVFSSFTGGLWVSELEDAIEGRRFGDWSLPFPAGISGTASDWCVIGQQTLVLCEQGHRRSFELVDLIARIEDAILRGGEKLWV